MTSFLALHMGQKSKHTRQEYTANEPCVELIESSHGLGYL